MTAQRPIPASPGHPGTESRRGALRRPGTWLGVAFLVAACRSEHPGRSEEAVSRPMQLVLVDVAPPSLDEAVPLAPDPQQRPAADGPPPIWFAVVLAPGARFDGSKGTFEQEGIERHVQFLQDCFARGELVMGGPFLDDSGALSLWQARGLEEARALASADPLVEAEVFVIQSVRPWMVALR